MTELRLGFGLPVAGSWASADNVAEIAETAEAHGFDSLWTFQRLLVPAEGSWGPAYRAVQDPLISLAYAAARTSRIRLGVAVLNAPFYPPLVLAKQLTTLDRLSGGRLDTGLGIGWAHEEFAAVGADKAGRGQRLEEFIECLRAIWGDDPVRFAGASYQVPPARIQPKPIQQPPPILLGGGAERALRRAGRLADGWISASRHELSQLPATIQTIRSGAVEAGRDPDRLRIVIRGVLDLGDERRGPDRRLLQGSPEQVHQDLDRLAEYGATEVFLDLNFDPQVSSPDGDATSAMNYAREVLRDFGRN